MSLGNHSATSWNTTPLPNPIAAVATAPARAQDFPSKTIKLVVPFPPGGPADTISRVFIEKMGTLVAQPIIIENRGGAAGMNGINAVARAEPDGHTIGIASSGTLAMNVVLQDKMPYDPLKDLVLMTQAVSVAELLVVGPSVPARTLAELLALAQAQPGKLNYASTGPGGMPHMATELLKVSARIDLTHVPYTGAAPAVNDLLGGHVQVMFADIPALLGAVQSGKLRALAVGTPGRVPILPDVPTTAESGLPQVEADNWYGMVVAAGTPPAVVRRLTELVVTTLRSDEVRERLAKIGVTAVGNSTEEFTAYVKREIERWGKVVQAAGVKLK